MKKDVIIVKESGQHETFDPEKLRNSLLNSGATAEAAAEVIQHCLPHLRDGMTTAEIYKHAAEVLERINKPVARSYSLRRAVMQLGPSGFPFEDFIAELLRAQGFECLTRQVVLGGCVPHEVDVVAWNKVKLIMVEAKFHNELGTKSDLKVVLYVKARWDDIKENVFNYGLPAQAGGKDRRVTDAWLVTNTKFSSTAIHYAECKGMTLIGWNYPEHGSLKDMIESEKLHPITCLTTLSESDKRALLAQNVVLCSSIKAKPELLNVLSHVDQGKVLAEINEL